MMKQRNLIFWLVLVTLLMACSGNQRPTPTPFAEADGTAAAESSATPQNITITDLAADPKAYADSVVTITGHYRRLPLLVCETDPHPSPATWQLEGADGSLIAVGGFDSQVRSLLPTDLTMTVAGVWQQFEGPVGCGKSATTMQIWYLKASDILSPSPIARVTLTPTGSGTQVADVDTGEATAVPTPSDGSQPPTPTLEITESEPTQTPTSASTTVPAPPGGGTPGGNATPTITLAAGGGTAVSTTTPTTNAPGTPGGNPGATPTTGSGTPTATGSSTGGGNPTATPQVFTTATRNPNDFSVIELDDLSGETPVIELLSEEEAHIWPILFDYEGAITVTAVSEATMNLVLEIIDPNKDVVQQANNTGNGGREAITNLQLNVAVDYHIRIYNLNATEGDYCLIFSEGGGFPDTIKGRLDYGQTITDEVAVLGIDYWCFLGSSGDSVDISVTSTGSEGDFVLGLFGPPDFGAIGPVFQDAEVENVMLTERGLHIIGVLDFDAGAAGYSLTLTKN